MALAILLSFLLIASSSYADILQNPDFESSPTNITTNNTSPFLLIAKVNAIPCWSFEGKGRGDKLQNPDFESPPTNMASNSTAPFLLLPKVNTIPGWSFEGIVHYITSGPNISLPGNGHGIQLGKGGKINQTFIADKYSRSYILTFSLAPGNSNCLNETVAVNVSVPGRSKVFSLQRRYGKEMWESHAYSLGRWNGEKTLINLVVQSVSVDLEADDTCSPIVDTFIIKRIGSPIFHKELELEYSTWIANNLLSNGGLENGPAFIKNSTQGILLDHSRSLLDDWTVIGTVKYINTKHYSVPDGKAAVELLPDTLSAIVKDVELTVGSQYTLTFMMGEASDSCLGEFVVFAFIEGAMVCFTNTMKSNGTGSAQNCSMTFKANSTKTTIIFTAFNIRKTSENIGCGPAIDNVILSGSYGLEKNLQNLVQFPFLIFMISLVFLDLCSRRLNQRQNLV